MRCFFGFHKWTKWETNPNREIIRYYGDGQKGKVASVQERTCSLCGIAHHRKVYAA